MIDKPKPRRRMRMILVGGIGLLASALVVLASCGPVKRPDGGVGLLPIGSTAPDLVARDKDGNPVRLSERRGHFDVVYFYPKDQTPGCTHEACAFRDAWDKYSALGITVFGVSRDSEDSHQEFRHKYALPFPLVADESGAIERAYGVSSILGMASRVTFLVAPDGRIARVWPNVDPAVHAAEVLAAATPHDAPAPTP